MNFDLKKNIKCYGCEWTTRLNGYENYQVLKEKKRNFNFQWMKALENWQLVEALLLQID